MKITRLFIHLFVLIVGAIFTNSSSADAPAGAEAPPVILPKAMDIGHDTIENRVNLFVNWVDEFFGSDRVFEETDKNYIKLSLGKTIDEDGKITNATKVSAKINLPRTQDRLKLLITSEPETEETAGNLQLQETLTGVNPNNEQSTALRYVAADTEIWNIHADLGLRFHSGIDPFTRFRVRRTVPLEVWTLHMAETLFWYDSLGPGETTHVDFERPVNHRFLFRATSEATWRKNVRMFDLVQDLTFLHKINEQRSMIYQASVYGITEPVSHVTNYLLSVRYRQLIHRDWLFFEINPQINYPTELHYAAVPTLTLRLDIIF